MELNITKFFNECAPMDYSASIAEIGRHAGAYTWRAACDDSPDYVILDTEDKRAAMRRYVKGFGAWSEDEIASWSDVELNALLMQMIAGDIRGADLSTDSPDWDKHQRDSEEGRVSGQLYRGDDGEIYYYIGS